MQSLFIVLVQYLLICACIKHVYQLEQSSRSSPMVNWCGSIKNQKRWFPSSEDVADLPPVSCPFALQKRGKPSGVHHGTYLQRFCWGADEFQNIYVRLLKRNGRMPKAPKCSQFGFHNQHATGWAFNMTWDTETRRGLASVCAFLCYVSFPYCSPKGRGIGTSPATFLIALCSLSSFSTTAPRDPNTREFKRRPHAAQTTQPFWQ